MKAPVVVGQRVQLIAMPNDPHPVEPYTKGTVHNVTEDPCHKGGWIIGVAWDNGRTLNLVTAADTFVIFPLDNEAHGRVHQPNEPDRP